MAPTLRYHGGMTHRTDSEVVPPAALMRRAPGTEAPGTEALNTEALNTEALNTWIELSRSAYLGNMAFLRRCVGPEVELSAVVKSNAYGHGLLPIAALAIEAGADSFCVHALDEALALRNAGFGQDILIMGTQQASGTLIDRSGR